MSKQIDALKLALEALEEYAHSFGANDLSIKAMYVAREALSSPDGEAQPEQRSVSEHLEPVAWWVPKAEQFCLPSSDGTRPFAKAWEPLYTTPPQGIYYSPPQRKPLTDEQILAANYPDGEENGPTIAAPDFELICFARQIEAAHGIKE